MRSRRARLFAVRATVCTDMPVLFATREVLIAWFNV